MKVKQDTLDSRLNHLKEICRESGMRMTHQRLEIFKEVAQTGDHPNVDQVYSGVKKRLPTISLDTVYRTLWMLVNMGLINTMSPSRNRTRFDANLDDHHHFVCIKCGMTRDFYNKEFNKLSIPETMSEFGTHRQTQVEVRGVCHQCNIENQKQKE